jgi:hypothetical protein
MTIDGSTGDIGGNPTSATAETSYLVTATNTGGQGNATVLIRTRAEPAPVIVYSDGTPVLYTANISNVTNSPTVTNGM